jgi:hypothetical protein
MNYKRIALGLLCGLLCVAPAFAGVVDPNVTKGDDVTESEGSVTIKLKSGSSWHVRDGKTSAFDLNVGNIKNCRYENGVYVFTGDSSNTAAINEAIQKIAYGLFQQVETGRGNFSGRNSYTFNEFKNNSGKNIRAWGYNNGIFDSGVSSKSNKKFFIPKDGSIERVEFGYSVSDGKGNSVTTQTGTDTSNLLFVGDVDDFTNTYAVGGEYHDTFKQNNTSVYQIDAAGYVSPVVLDLDGDGAIEASSGKYLAHPSEFDYCGYVAMFDFHGNGFPVLTEWVGENDGLLCRPEADGSVKGANLFGTTNGSENGYDDMAILDANKNGTLEGAELEGLYVWQDRNSNGIADKGELSTVQSLGITSISVKHDNMSSTFVRNGQTFKSFDWWPSVQDVRRVKVSTF